MECFLRNAPKTGKAKYWKQTEKSFGVHTWQTKVSPSINPLFETMFSKTDLSRGESRNASEKRNVIYRKQNKRSKQLSKCKTNSLSFNIFKTQNKNLFITFLSNQCLSNYPLFEEIFWKTDSPKGESRNVSKTSKVKYWQAMERGFEVLTWQTKSKHHSRNYL